MHENLQFKISAELKNIIGKDLIADDFSAIFELVKNSYDAHADFVRIIFKNLNSSKASIIISDNGKGMNYQDIVKKWLFVAYSAKKDGTEDLDYRNRINKRTYYAGAKGIGRFSCDKLGKKLKLTSVKDESKPKVEELEIDWEQFEKNSKDNFIDINVKHRSYPTNPDTSNSGTTLEITELRNDPEWDYQKLLKLKKALAKLINPFEGKNDRPFDIIIEANEFEDSDKLRLNEKERINGIVENNILDILKLKTIQIRVQIPANSRLIKTDLFNNGEWLYSIEEKNLEYPLLDNILVELFYLNRSSKTNFTRLMGLRSTDYGSVFLYKNGIRIYPFGEPGEDSFSLDSRKSLRLGNYLGTNDIIGRIEILGDNHEFQEASSRGNGLIKNSSYTSLKEFFIDKAISKLEAFRRTVMKYGVDFEEIDLFGNQENALVKLISGNTNSNAKIDISHNVKLLEIIGKYQEDNENAFGVINRVKKIARDSNIPSLFDEIEKINTTLKDAINDANSSSEQIVKAERIIEEHETENLFLKSIKSQDFSELVSLMHHIGISAGIVNNHTKILSYKMDKNIPIGNEELANTLSAINFENQKILSISRFATKANFKVNAEKQLLDLVAFIREYSYNIANIFLSNLKIKIKKGSDISFNTVFRPLEMTILLDNLLNNSKKAKAKVVEIQFNLHSNGNLEMLFKDDGIGIPKSKQDLIFNFGYTTTNGSGVGLFHIVEILHKIGGTISVNKEIQKGTEFIIIFKR